MSNARRYTLANTKSQNAKTAPVSHSKLPLQELTARLDQAGSTQTTTAHPVPVSTLQEESQAGLKQHSFATGDAMIRRISNHYCQLSRAITMIKHGIDDCSAGKHARLKQSAMCISDVRQSCRAMQSRTCCTI